MPISCTWLADSKIVRVVMKVMISVMIESKNDDDDFCGGSGGERIIMFMSAGKEVNSTVAYANVSRRYNAP